MMRICLIISILIIFSACSVKDPKSMAKEYCECIQKSIETSDLQTCSELAKEHKVILEGDQDKMQKYSDELVNCTNVSR